MLDKLPQHVQDKIEVCPFYDCWLCESDINNRGYARVWCWGIRFLAHKFVYEYLNPSVKLKGLELDHLCNTRKCVNPAHLEPVTHQENNIRRVERERKEKLGRVQG